MNHGAKELKKLIEESEKVLITTHAIPDTDAKVSTAIVYHTLKNYFKKKDLDLLWQGKDKYPDIELNLGESEEVSVRTRRDDQVDLSNYDLIILTDVDELRRALENTTGERKNYSIVVIDHHQPSVAGESEADLFINNQLSSASEQLYHTFKEIFGDEWAGDEYIARLIQYAIVDDTGRFMYDSVKPSTYEVMAELIRVVKVDLEEFSHNMNRMTFNSYKVLQQALENFRVVDNYGYSWITKDFIIENNLTSEDYQAGAVMFLNDYMRRLEGIDWGFIVKESFAGTGEWGVSFRSIRGAKEVNKIAEKLGGGGHHWAASARLKAEDKDDAIQQVLSAVS
jgi:phosphoesterase RecJ-like protein